MKRVCVRVPATSANLGPGFDCLGVALDLANEFEFCEADRFRCVVHSTVSPEDARQVATDERNLAWRAFTHLFEHLGKTPPTVALTVMMHVPLGRGLGSSATAIVGGIAAANRWLGSPLSTPEWLLLASRLEGHPDNVVPAALGGCQLSILGETLLTCALDWHPQIALVLAVPDFALATSKARAALPKTVPHTDAVFNAVHLALLVRALATGDARWLAEALQDRLHQPYRTGLIPGWQDVRAAALEAGAWGVVISGAGPSVLALTHLDCAEAVRQAMASTWPNACLYCPGLDPNGCRVEVEAG